MSKPTHINLGPISIPIRYADDPDHFGFYDEKGGDPYISIASSLTDDNLWMTLFHEAMEAMNERYGLGLKESQIRTLEMVITAMLKDNPEFASRLGS